MISLLLAICSSAMVSIIMRLSTGRVSAKMSMLAANYLTCLSLGAFFAGAGDLFPAVEGLGAALGMGVVSGFLYLAGFVLLQYNVKKNGVVLAATFMKLGLLVSVTLSVLWFGERPSVFQGVGFLLALCAIVLINWRGDGKGELRWSLPLLLLAGGCGDAMSKVFSQYGSPALSAHYLFYIFLVAFLLCAALVIRGKERPGKTEVGFGVLIGIPNFFTARFLLRAVESLSAVIVYPTFSVGTLLVVTMAGVLVFRERLERRQWAAVAVILAALALLNL